MPLNRVPFMNTYIDNITLDEAIERIEICIKERHIGQIITPNVDQIVRLEWDEYFCKICKNSELLLVDGHPLIWIAKLYGQPFKEKICGSDLVPKLCELAVLKGYSIFLLGAAPGVAKKAAENLRMKWENLKIAGTYSPPIGFETDSAELSKMNEMLRNSNADMLFVGMGVPKQDIFIFENMNKYQIPMSFSIGGTIDFLAGFQKRAPVWMNKLGFEWLYRFLCNPKRMFKRYFINDLKIIKMFWKYRTLR
jgi:N-acetylglucosaminyldiphosphoundecaprenol N-acetyl-beta-D-mannosaminyltransferase